MNALVAALSAGSPAAQDRAVAGDQAEQLAAELAGAQPDGKRVRMLWDRLHASLDAVKVGVDVAKIAEFVARLC